MYFITVLEAEEFKTNALAYDMGLIAVSLHGTGARENQLPLQIKHF